MNKKMVLYILVFAILISGFILVYEITKKDVKKSMEKEKKNNEITQEDVNDIYAYLHNVNCNDTLIWDVNEGEELTIDNFPVNKMLDLVFRHLEVNNKLSNEIFLEEFNNSKKIMFGANYAKDLPINNYKYKNYTYNLAGDKIIREESTSCDVEFNESASFGYTRVNNPLIIHVAVGYSVGNYLYDLDNNNLGTFTDEITKKEMLLNSTTFEYSFAPDNNILGLATVRRTLKVYPE